MVAHKALGVDSARARARVHALLVHAGLVACTVGVSHAFRSTPGVRVSLVFRKAGAGPCSVAFLTNRIGSAGGGVARVPLLFRGQFN